MSFPVTDITPARSTGDYRKFFFDLNNKATTREIDITRIPLEGTKEAWRVVDIQSMDNFLGSAPSHIVIVQIPMIGTDGDLGFYKPTTNFNWAIAGVSDAPGVWMLGMFVSNESAAGESGNTMKYLDDTGSGTVYDHDIFVYFNSTQALDTGIICITLERMELDSLGKMVCLFNQSRKTRQRGIAED